MAAALLNIPTIFINGGPMLPGSFEGQKLTVSKGLEMMFGAAMLGLPQDAVKENFKLCLSWSWFVSGHVYR